MCFYMKSRWRPEGRKLVYYGMRYGKNLNKNVIKLSARQAEIINKLPIKLDKLQYKAVRKLVKQGIITKNPPIKIPTSFAEARFCTSCPANDFMIPGLEFGKDGLCPICAAKKQTEELKSVVPIATDIPKAKKSRFDVAVFYTGGKDSTYLLYYLSKVRGLKVLALTWLIPFASDSAIKSIENARKFLPNVEFMTRAVADCDLKKIYRRLYSLNENTCACPSLAYALFYPTLVEERVPYFVAGNEPAQMAGLYFNGMAPKIAYKFADSKILNFFVNLGRVLTLHPPLRRGQFHSLTTMSQLAFGTNKLVKLFGYRNELVENVTTALHEVPEIVMPLKRAVRRSSRTGNIPAFVQVDFDRISGGKYDWRKVKDLIARECGWVAPEEGDKGLHTSCKIEKCKEYSQFIRFYKMRSRMIPFSAIEMSIAGQGKNLTREEAIAEIENSLGFSLKEVPECEIMKDYLK